MTTLLFTACSKKEIKTPAVPEGLWTGKYTVQQAPQSGARPLYLVLKPGGSLLVEAVADNGALQLGPGTWQRSAEVLTLSYILTGPSGNAIAHEATVTLSGNVLSAGSWRQTGGTGLSGGFSDLTRVP
ncbi:MAG TPA: hypothetical protein VHK69_05675 [Chitinophagaceae bacterium]|nr:hypothetical protein [Chitinophagaceae bacterium]